MKFVKERTNGYLFGTEVENIFIGEYMTDAPGDYVKVYLYGLMCASLGQTVSTERVAKLLAMDATQVERAFLYWEEHGVVRRGRSFYNEGGGPEEILEFVSLREALYGGGNGGSGRGEAYGAGAGVAGGNDSGGAGGNNGYGRAAAGTDGREPSGSVSALHEKKLADLYHAIEKIIGRPLGGKELTEIYGWIEDFSATTETIVTAYSYCKKTYQKDSASYVGKVVKNWTLKGLDNVLKIDEYLSDIDRNRALHKRVFKALGFSRNPTEEEKRIMNSWFVDMEYPIDKVLEACRKTSGISNPNLNYVNKILTDWYREKNGALPGEDIPVTIGVVMKYYDYLRENAERTALERKEEIYGKLPEIRQIDEEMRQAGIELTRVMLSGRADKGAAVKEIQDRIDSMLAEKAAILTENSYPVDYMDPKYKCTVCGDTGTTEDGERCSCFEQRMEEAKAWQISERKSMSKTS